MTFRFWFLTTFWVTVGCAISTFYYFKPYYQSLSSYAIQLLAWGMGDAMARWLPKRTFKTFGYEWSLNPGPWNAKEHALVVVAYWGSCYTAYGLGPLSALEIYYGQKINPGWAILFLLTTQMVGYGFVGTYRDVLVRPPKMYYPGVLSNVALFNAMHKNPSMTKKALAFFAWVAVSFFCWEWFPEFIFPVLSSLPLLCWMGHGNPIAYVLGSGNYGFGILDISLDWNYINNGVLAPMYTPLWSAMTQCTGVFLAVWLLYPILYYTNVMDSQNFGAVSSKTYDSTGSTYNISRVLTPDFRLNQTAMDEYSRPFWSTPYVFYFFWGFAASSGAMIWSMIWYGKDIMAAAKNLFFGRRDTNDYNDPYLKLMSFDPRVPHSWYLILLVISSSLSILTIYCGGFQLPWWGFILMAVIAWVFTIPNGCLWARANTQVGMSFLSELICGSLFHGQPKAMLAGLVYARQIMEQNLNLISDYKFGFYMKIPEREMFIAQVYGTLIGPFINVALMQVVIKDIGIPTLTGVIPSVNWYAAQSRNYYSLSVLWGLMGPASFFGGDSPYKWVYYAFLVGPAAVGLMYALQRWKPHWDIEHCFNLPLGFYGICTFPVYPTTNFLSSFIASLVSMGWVHRYRPVWFRKYHYLFGMFPSLPDAFLIQRSLTELCFSATGADCGTQIMQTVLVFAINLPNLAFPAWWGNNLDFPDLCFPPNDKLPAAMQILLGS